MLPAVRVFGRPVSRHMGVFASVFRCTDLGVTTTIRLDHNRSIYDHGRSHNGHIHLQTHPHPPHPQHTAVGGCGMKWGYAVVPEHPHTPWGMWGSLVHHCNAHTDRSRHISVDSDPHPHARMTHRTARRGWFVDVLRVIWWCLRVFWIGEKLW